MVDRRPYHHGNLKQELLDVGIALLEESGLEALSLRAIASRVGVSHTAPRNHFGNLRGLLTAIAAEGFRRHASAMRAGLPEGASRSERLMAAAEGYVRFARENPGLFTLMFSSQHCDLDDPELRAAARMSYAVLADIAVHLAAGFAEEPNARLRAETMLWSVVHGYAQLAATRLLGGPDGCDKPDISEIVSALAREG